MAGLFKSCQALITLLLNLPRCAPCQGFLARESSSLRSLSGVFGAGIFLATVLVRGFGAVLVQSTSTAPKPLTRSVARKTQSDRKQLLNSPVSDSKILDFSRQA